MDLLHMMKVQVCQWCSPTKNKTSKQFEFCNSLFRKYLSVHDGSSGGSGAPAGSTAASATGVGWVGWGGLEA